MANPGANPAAEQPSAEQGELIATIEHDAGAHDAGHAPPPAAFGLIGPAAWVSLAFLVLIAIAIWKKVPGVIAGGLDSKIAEIRKQLEEAKVLRAEAEALRKEYADKIANAEKDAAAMVEHARSEAELIVAKAQADTEAMIVRRKKMAEDKIAAAERGAVDELRAKAAAAAALAAKRLIAEKHDAQADRKLVDQSISGI